MRFHVSGRPGLITVGLVGLAGLLTFAPVGALAAKSRPAARVVQSDSALDVVLYGRREDVAAFARQAAESEGLDPEWTIAQLAQARYQPTVAKLVMPPPAGTAKNWAAYRSRFVEAQRIREGLRWWQSQEPWLNQAQARWGVPPEIIVSIVGVETFYGRITGGFKVLDALATLSFDFPAGRSDRSAFYRGELQAFLRWCADEGRDPQSVKGSYAGAMGLPQFMPSTLRRYAVDFDGDGRIDLEANGADVVGSVGHYFAQHGWQEGLPTTFAVTPPADLEQRARLLVPDILPTFTSAQMAEAGARLDEAGRAHEGQLALVQLFNGDEEPSYVAGTRNFYVVTRYNWSSYYAMAVIELARALKQMRPPVETAAPAKDAADRPTPASSDGQPAATSG
ncbi:lytic murein transglycosylase B [Ideonella sp. YS5]|uniref:lytic murein transglycosylase B n=1 Tax=Ideonella sp. YS5 TaxID=3453714 RepID=UPI003EE8C77F